MRIFIAIPIPDDCLEQLSRVQEQLKQTMADVRWTRIASVHLTLKFLGEMDPRILPALAESLHDASSTVPALNLRLSGLGSFPNRKKPRIVWCGIDGDLDTLTVLQERIETACAAIGFPRENRSFKPHLTIGRVKSGRNMQMLMDRMETVSGKGICSFHSARLNVYKSVLKPQGAVYTILETIALEPAPEDRT